MPIFDHDQPNIIKVISTFLNLHQHAQNQLNSSIHCCNIADLECCDLKGATPT